MMQLQNEQSTMDIEPINSQHQVILNSLDSALVIIDEDGIVQYVNVYPEIYACLVAQPLLPGESIFKAIPSDWHLMARNVMKNVAYSKNPVTLDASCENKGGGKYYFDIKCKAIKGNTNKKQLLLAEVQEVTIQKIFERKIGAIASEMSDLIQNANAVIIATDCRGYITEWNLMSAKITGYSKSEAIMKQVSQLLLDTGFQEEFSFILNKVAEGETLSNYELPIKSKDNQQKIFLINATPKRNTTGKVIGILLVGQDVSELIGYRNSLEVKVKERTKKLAESYRVIKEQKNQVEAERKKSDDLLLNILPDTVAVELKERGVVEPRRYNQATVLFVDLVGFTLLSKGLNPELMVDELNTIFTGFDSILEKHHLEKIKTIGDGYMAVGGIPIENATNPKDAVHAGLEMIEFIKQLSKGRLPWELRIGIHTGELVAGVIGKSKFAYDVWGASVNIASRMESAGIPGRVNISEATYRLVADLFECTCRGDIQAKNMGSMNMYLVDKIKKDVS
jgi:PAS domain S-box-containing protein